MSPQQTGHSGFDDGRCRFLARLDNSTNRIQVEPKQQEQKAEVVGNQAALIQAEAEVPKAMANAFRTGNIDTKG